MVLRKDLTGKEVSNGSIGNERNVGCSRKRIKVKKKTTCQLFENLDKTFFSLKIIGGKVN